MSNAIFRIKLHEDKDFIDQLNLDYKGLSDIKHVDNEGFEDILNGFYVGANIRIGKGGGLYEVTKVSTQNGPLDTYIDVVCEKIS